MPSFLVKAFASKYKKPVAEVERIWKQTSEEALKKFRVKSDRYYAYVNATVQSKLGGSITEDTYNPFNAKFEISLGDLEEYDHIEVEEDFREFKVYKDGEVLFYEELGEGEFELVNHYEDHS